MPLLSPLLERMGWRSAILISPHPPEECRRRLRDAVGRPLSLDLPASGTFRAASASLFWNDDSWTGINRTAGLNLMGQPILEIRWSAQGVGARLLCRSGVSWIVAGLWVGFLSFFFFVDREMHDVSLHALMRAVCCVLFVTAFFAGVVVMGHSLARGVEDKLIDYVAQTTDAVPADE